MKKRTIVRIISFLSAACLALGGFLLKNDAQNRYLKLQITNGYSKSLNDFHSCIDNISLLLNKARYATDAEQISSMAAKLLSVTELSKSALSQLPQNGELSVLNRFLSQVGNFSLSVSKSLISGNQISRDDYNSLETLAETAQKIAEVVSTSKINANNINLWASELEREIGQTVEESDLTAYLDQLEGERSDFPTLIYDGPFSDHIYEKEPELLKGKASITENEAKQKAAEFCSLEDNALSLDGITDGFIPSYRFLGDGISVSISIKGGYCVYLKREHSVERNLISIEKARQKANEFLRAKSLSLLAETYYFESDGICVINFAYLDGETICYTDLIKVGISMDTGEVVLFEAGGYISNHKERAFQSPVFTPEEAKAKLSPALTLKTTSLALIPTDSLGEVRCYEFACAAEDNQEILVYINTLTLAEEDILILLKADNGILVK